MLSIHVALSLVIRVGEVIVSFNPYELTRCLSSSDSLLIFKMSILKSPAIMISLLFLYNDKRVSFNLARKDFRMVPGDLYAVMIITFLN